MIIKVMNNTKIYLIVYSALLSVANSAPVSEQNEQANADRAQSLTDCKTTQEYPSLLELSFNPYKIVKEDIPCLSLKVFREMGFVNYFNLPVDTLSRFIVQVYSSYRDVPYHNSRHGFAVFHFSSAVLKNTKIIEKHHLSQLEGLALLTASMCHDVDHRGTNNQFQIEINNSLAQKYKDQGSIMERHHIEVTLDLLNNPKTNFVASLDDDKNIYFKDLIKQIILATDLDFHFKLLPEEKAMAVAGFDKMNIRHRELLRSNIISCADIGNQIWLDWASVRTVTKNIYTEFFAQGDQERWLGLQPTALMDRTTAKIPQQQVGFLSHVMSPNFHVLLLLYPETQVSMDNIQQNFGYWQKSTSYFEEQSKRGRQQIDILCDNKLDNIVD